MDGNWYVRRGRIDRTTFWLHYALPLAAASWLATWVEIQAGLAWYSSDLDLYTFTTQTTYRGGPISLLTSLVLLAPSISGFVTRLHDRGHSAHWLWFFLLPIVGPVLLVVQAGFLAGEPGPNAYGSPEGAVVPAPRTPSWKAPTSA